MFFNRKDIEEGIGGTQCEGVSNGKGKFVVLCVSGLRKSIKSGNYQPKAFVVSKKLVGNELSSACYHSAIPLSHMKHVTPGTIWENNILVGRYTTPSFLVEVNNDNYHIRRLSDVIENLDCPKLIKLMYEGGVLQNIWILDFLTNKGEHILIPCIEYFLRAYGISGELLRVLTTYSFDGKGKDILYPSFTPEVGREGWQLKKPANGIVKDDRYFLAHAKYVKRGRIAARSIYSNIEAAFNNSQNKNLALIKVEPWYEGLSELKISGEYVSESIIWVWNLRGMSFPKCEEILFLSERPVLASPEDIDTNEDTGAFRFFRKPTKEAEQEMPLVDESPDIDTPSYFMEGEKFQLIGRPPNTEFKTLDKDVEKGGGKKEKEHADKVAGGNRDGSGNGVGKAVTHSKVELVDGAILNVWNGLIMMSQIYTPQIKNISWYSLSKGKLLTHKEDPEPILFEKIDKEGDISLEALFDKIYEDNTEREKHIKQCNRWISSFSEERNRGIVVFSVEVNQQKYFLIEIEREISTLAEGNQKEKNYKGLIYYTYSEKKEIVWLKDLLRFIPLTKGVFKRIYGRCPGKAHAFVHSTSHQQLYEGEKAILTAFDRIGVKFTKIKKE